jgi:hypothetical protein
LIVWQQIANIDTKDCVCKQLKQRDEAMKKMMIFDPAMCCSTGVCGPAIDPELLRVSTVLNNLHRNGIVVERHNLTSNPAIFVENKIINNLLNSEGVAVLPVTLVDGQVVKTQSYPTNEELCKMLDIPEDLIKIATKINLDGCGCGCNGECC